MLLYSQKPGNRKRLGIHHSEQIIKVNIWKSRIFLDLKNEIYIYITCKWIKWCGGGARNTTREITVDQDNEHCMSSLICGWYPNFLLIFILLEVPIELRKVKRNHWVIFIIREYHKTQIKRWQKGAVLEDKNRERYMKLSV